MSERSTTVSRRSALSALAGTLVTVGCGGSNQSTPGSAGGSAGNPGSGGGAGAGGSASGGEAGSSGGAGVAGSGGQSCKLTPTPGCKITDDNILGPYYKADAPFRDDITDGQAGTLLWVKGTVYDCDCVTPLAGATVDIWQANDSGAYDNTGYVLRGKMQTDAQGHYEYKTILPGFYLNGATYRPRHIHYKVSHPGGIALTTQLYFEGDPYIPGDAFVKQSLVMPVTEETTPNGGKQLHVTFDVVLA